MRRMRVFWRACSLSCSPLARWRRAAAQEPAAIAAPGENAGRHPPRRGRAGLRVQGRHDGKLAWAFREPIATLVLDGKTVGRHYAGPSWEYMDGSAVVGRPSAMRRARARPTSPGSSSKSPRIAAAACSRPRHHGAAHQHGGRRPRGACDKAGTLHSAPYATDTFSCARDRESAQRPRLRDRSRGRNSALTDGAA